MLTCVSRSDTDTRSTSSRARASLSSTISNPSESVDMSLTDDLVIPSRIQQFDVLLRPRYWFVNVLSLYIGVSLGKLLSRVLFPSLHDPTTGVLQTLVAAQINALPLVSVGTILLVMAGSIWAVLVPDYSDSAREYCIGAPLNTCCLLTSRSEGARECVGRSDRGRHFSRCCQDRG